MYSCEEKKDITPPLIKTDRNTFQKRMHCPQSKLKNHSKIQEGFTTGALCKASSTKINNSRQLINIKKLKCSCKGMLPNKHKRSYNYTDSTLVPTNLTLLRNESISSTILFNGRRNVKIPTPIRREKTLQ